MNVKLFEQLTKQFIDYTDVRTLETSSMNHGLQLRIEDIVAMVDIWPSTGKYHIVVTHYAECGAAQIKDRSGERGMIPKEKQDFDKFLDSIIYAVDMAE